MGIVYTYGGRKNKAKYNSKTISIVQKFSIQREKDKLIRELFSLDTLEYYAFQYFDELNIPPEKRKWYLGFLKKVWRQCYKYTQETRLNNVESLIYEYVQRGLDEQTLRELAMWVLENCYLFNALKSKVTDYAILDSSTLEKEPKSYGLYDVDRYNYFKFA